MGRRTVMLGLAHSPIDKGVSLPRSSRANSSKNRAASLSRLEAHLLRLEQPPIPDIDTLSERVRDLPFPALLTDDTGAYVVANAAASRLTGYRANELRGMSVWDLNVAAEEHDTDVLWRHFIRVGTQRGIFKLRTKNGSVVSAHYVAKSHVIPGFHLSLLELTE